LKLCFFIHYFQNDLEHLPYFEKVNLVY